MTIATAISSPLVANNCDIRLTSPISNNTYIIIMLHLLCALMSAITKMQYLQVQIMKLTRGSRGDFRSG
jgi:hypothetical protein